MQTPLPDVEPSELQIRLAKAGNYITLGTLYWVAAYQTIMGKPVTVSPKPN